MVGYGPSLPSVATLSRLWGEGGSGRVRGAAGGDLARLTLPLVGEVVAIDELDVPYTVTDAAGQPVEPVTEFMRDFSARAT